MKITGLITLLCIFTMAFPALGTTVTIGNYSVEPDGSVVAQMMANNVTNLGSVTVNLTFDPAVVHVTSIVQGPHTWTFFVPNIDNSSGFAAITVGDFAGNTGSVVIASLTLTAVGSGATSSLLNIGITDFADSLSVQMPVTPINGIFSITASGTQTNSGGGGGGGGGVLSGEDFANIAKSESYDKDLVANKPVTYTFKAPELGVYEIALTDKENELGITLKVEGLKDTSKQVTAQAPGTVYRNMNIIAGTQRMKEALVRFRVENSWLGSNGLAGSDVKLLHWDGSQWTQLETAQTTKDDTYTYYEAKTTTLSPFAISVIKGGVSVPTAAPAGVVTETPGMPTGTGTPAPATTSKAPAFEFGLSVAILSVVYLLGRKRR